MWATESGRDALAWQAVSSSFMYSFGNYLLTIFLYPWDTTEPEATREDLTCVSYEEWVNRQGVLCRLGGRRQLGRNIRVLTPGKSLTSLSQEEPWQVAIRTEVS